MDIERDADAQGDVENRCKETLEVMQTSAGHGADPSTTKPDLYAALLNPENVPKICSAAGSRKFPETLASCFSVSSYFEKAV